MRSSEMHTEERHDETDCLSCHTSLCANLANHMCGSVDYLVYASEISKASKRIEGCACHATALHLAFLSHPFLPFLAIGNA